MSETYNDEQTSGPRRPARRDRAGLIITPVAGVRVGLAVAIALIGSLAHAQPGPPAIVDRWFIQLMRGGQLTYLPATFGSKVDCFQVMHRLSATGVQQASCVEAHVVAAPMAGEKTYAPGAPLSN